MINLAVISSERKALMGIAILFIMLYHSAIIIPLPWLEPVVRNGDFGVEIFALLSGLGVYFSLNKNPNVVDFYKRRVKRILPAFFLVAIPLGLFRVFHFNASWGHFFSLITGLATFRGDYTFWFISYVCIFYLTSPLLYKLIQRIRVRFLLSLISLPICFLISFALKDTVDNLEWIPRLALFPLGMEVGHMIINMSPNDYSLRSSLVSGVFIFAVFLVLSILDIKLLDLRYLIYFFLVIPVSYSLAILVSRCDSIPRFLSIIGGLSLELYLVHQHICIPLARLCSNNPNLLCLLSLVFAVVLSSIIAYLSSLCVKLCEHRR